MEDLPLPSTLTKCSYSLFWALISSGIPFNVSAPIPSFFVFLEERFSFFSPKIEEIEDMPVLMDANWSTEDFILLILLVASSIDTPASVKISAREEFFNDSFVSFPVSASSSSFFFSSRAVLSISSLPDLPMYFQTSLKDVGVKGFSRMASNAFDKTSIDVVKSYP